jgi:hypothetical protein
LDKSKIKASFGVLVPDYKESLTDVWGCLNDFLNYPSPKGRNFKKIEC